MLSSMLARNSAIFPRLWLMSAQYRAAGLSPRLAAPVTTSVQEEQAKFWQKNAQMKRPMSPHLTIYKPQLTSMLSITHRATGAALTGGLYLFAMHALVVPAFGWDFTAAINMIKGWELPWAAIVSAKWLLAWPVAYHTLNGFRHMAWDLGYGFNISTLYKSGWIVFLSSFLVADLMVFLL